MDDVLFKVTDEFTVLTDLFYAVNVNTFISSQFNFHFRTDRYKKGQQEKNKKYTELSYMTKMMATQGLLLNEFTMQNTYLTNGITM